MRYETSLSGCIFPPFAFFFHCCLTTLLLFDSFSEKKASRHDLPASTPHELTGALTTEIGRKSESHAGDLELSAKSPEEGSEKSGPAVMERRSVPRSAAGGADCRKEEEVRRIVVVANVSTLLPFTVTLVLSLLHSEGVIRFRNVRAVVGSSSGLQNRFRLLPSGFS